MKFPLDRSPLRPAGSNANTSTTTMKATDILPASQIPGAFPAGTKPSAFPQQQRRRRKAHRQRGHRPSRGAMLSVVGAALLVFGAAAALLVVALAG